MRVVTIVIFLLLFFGEGPGVPLLGQTVPVPTATDGPGRISGTITDADGEALATVSVTLRSAADSALVTGTLTGPSGSFRIDGLPLGSYLLHVGRLGFTPRSSEAIELTSESPHVELGAIQLDMAPITLEGVEVTVDRPSIVVEADRTTYDVRQMPIAGVGTAADVLRAVPELEVDVNDNVRLRGNQAAAIHLNGRPTPMRGEQLASFLRQLPGDRIDSVEVMPNPSARHDPEGMGGIVNIVLREDVEIGLSGSLTVNMSTRGTQALSGRFNVQRGRLTLFSGGSVNRGRMAFENWNHRRNLVTDPITIIEQTALSTNRSRGWNGDWTAELNVGEGATLWSNAWLFHSGNDSEGRTLHGITDDFENVQERYDRADDRRGAFGNFNFTTGFRKVFERGREEFSIDARLTRGGNESDVMNLRLFEVLGGEEVSLPPELMLNDIAANNGNLSIQTDYFRPIGEGRVDIGYRAWQRNQDNDNLLRIFETEDATELIDEAHSGFEYEEVFHSLYGTLAGPVGRFRAQIGLRAEYSTTTFDSRVRDDVFERSYLSLFPSANVSWDLGSGRTLRALYSRRIGRPPPQYLDPFVPSTDPLNRFLGNPELEASYSDSYTLDLTMNGQRGTLRVAPYYRHSTQVWERIRTVDSDGVATSRWENSASSSAVGTNLTVSLRPMGRLSGSTNLGVYRESRDGTNIRADLSGAAWMWSLGGNVGVRLHETLTAQVTAHHFPSQSVLQGRASGFSYTQIALRQQLFERRGSISFSVSDPFNMNRYTSSVIDPTFTQASRSSQQSRLFTVGFTVNLGRIPERQSRPSQGPDSATGETIRVP